MTETPLFGENNLERSPEAFLTEPGFLLQLAVRNHTATPRCGGHSWPGVLPLDLKRFTSSEYDMVEVDVARHLAESSPTCWMQTFGRLAPRNNKST
ncbi:MAG: hypothetical protein KUA37_13900 [Desulfomicrobium sp.]|uniref:hypothetical protein n=1 Tax=Hoeflea sp. TaxID=1940281 RepID=UPI0025C3E7BE|nr:hypothetical protein [Hoeflea sp.]MBU4528043.1 hypothetical protein [Alphaproteobacteria bacterium]MBV1713077.1 hypothetical protein [Desulfomicrobium sp.]MBU4543368.1 hypothetical protein [Alphaproteobacteria bacterium]MBU4550057.1 hypothetical protein [Alphaproteobacteria bacterium]MBV1785446.1 hypothetical protein [Hoeflea sp.]